MRRSAVIFFLDIFSLLISIVLLIVCGWPHRSCAIPKCSSLVAHAFHAPRQQTMSPKGALVLTHLDEFHAWGWDWQGPRQGVPSSESFFQVPTCLSAPVLLWAGVEGPLMGWWLLEWAWEPLELGVIWAPPPAVVSLCPFVCVQISF